MTRRNKTKAQSPYQKYNKRPHVYSGAYYAWRATIMRGSQTIEVREAARRRDERAARQERRAS
jgi:hypothetical protein